MCSALSQLRVPPYQQHHFSQDNVGFDVLKQLDDGVSYAIKNVRVSNEDLDALISRKDIRITEVAAPLSSVDVMKLLKFLEVHGQNIVKFNLQNAVNVDNASFINMMSYMPQLEVLSLQYQHQLTNDVILQVLEDHPLIDTISLSLNRGLSKNLFFEILKKNRIFKKVSLDLSPTSKKTPLTTVAARINHLALIGRTFQNNDVPIFEKISTLQNLKLVLTSIDAAHVVHLMNSLNKSSDVRVVVSNFSDVESSKFLSDLDLRNNVSTGGFKIKRSDAKSVELSWS